MNLIGQGRSVLRLRLLPLVLLLTGLSTLLFFGRVDGVVNDRHFLSHQHLALAVNLSPSHHFLGFSNQIYGVSGDIAYAPYNRFPPGGYFLIKLVTLVVGDDLSIQIAAAQVLMVAFFAGTVVLAYWSLCRLISNRWIASTAVFLGFASPMMLIHSTAIVPEIMPDLFGVSLTFHGMIIFVQRGSFRQLVIKACLALLLGWHVLALLLPFIFLSLAKEIIQARKARMVPGASLSFIYRVVTSRYFALGFVVLGFGILILAYNIANEYYALNFKGTGDQLALLDLPSVDSAFRRTGTDLRDLDEWVADDYEIRWDIFLFSQLERLSYLAIPFAWWGGGGPPAAPGLIGSSYFAWPSDSWAGLGRKVPWAALAGTIIVGVCVIGAIHLKRHRLLALTAILSGFCWSIPMRYNTDSNIFESLYYVGVIVFFHTLILSLLYKWSGKGKQLFPLGAVGGLVLFVTSSYRVAPAEVEDYSDESFRNIDSLIIDDVEVIRRFADGKNILIYSRPDIPVYDPHDWGWYPYVWPYGGLYYYLHRSGLIIDSPLAGNGCIISSDRVDFILQPKQSDAQGLLTPDNRVMYLYDRYIYEERVDRIVGNNRPVVQGDFDVYLTDDRELIYVRDRCTLRLPSMLDHIHLTVYPVNPSQNHEFHSFTPLERFIVDTKRYVYRLRSA